MSLNSFEKKINSLPGKVLGKVLKANPITAALGEVKGLISGAGKALGLGPTRADKRKDRTRLFHEAIRREDREHVQKTASDRGEGGTRFQGLKEEALWVLQQLDAGFSWGEVRKALAGNGGAEARGGRLPNLDGTPNNTRGYKSWRSTPGIAREVELTAESAPVSLAPTRTRTTRSRGSAATVPSSRPPNAPRTLRIPARAPRPKPPCAYGPRGSDGYCPKKPKVARVVGAAGGGRPCAYGPRLANGRCPTKPKVNKQAAAAQKKLEGAVTGALTSGGKYIYKALGPLGTVKLLAKASLVGAAGVAAYALTKKLLTLRPKSWADAKYELAKATTAARAAARASKPELDWNDPAVNAREMAGFNSFFKERKKIMDDSEALGVPPHLEFIFDDDNPTYGNPYQG